MAGGAGGAGGAWSRRVAVRARALRGLARDTGRALRDVRDVLAYEADIPQTVQEIGQLASRPTALVVLGTCWAARVRLLHGLLGRRLLPDCAPRARRCLRFQYGSSTQVHLTVGDSEFELVGELEANAGPWDTVPVGDLTRKDHNDLSTVLEIELDNSFLKDGLQIVIPPDIAEEPAGADYLHLKRAHAELYGRRARLLTNFNPVYLFAVDRIGGRVFRDHIGRDIGQESDTVGDFWSRHDLYSLARSGGAGVERVEGDCGGGECDYPASDGDGEEPVFDGENCLDLHQVKEMDPHAQLLFVLFSDSVPLREMERDRLTPLSPSSETSGGADVFVYKNEALQDSDQGSTEHGVIRTTIESPDGTEAGERRLTEEQTAFLSDLLDHWEMMTKPPPKHYFRSQTMILNDGDIALGAGGPGAAGGRRGGARGALVGAAVRFAGEAMHCALLQHCTQLSEIHVKLLQQFILASFDLARELQVVPRKIQYAATQESLLYESICEKFSGGDKQQELVLMMRDVLQETRAEIEAMDWSVDDLPCHQDLHFHMSNSVFYSSESPDKVSTPLSNGDSGDTGHAGDVGHSGGTGRSSNTADDPASDVEEAVSYDSYNFDDYEILHSNTESVNAAGRYQNKVASVEEVTSLSSLVSLIPVENERDRSGEAGGAAGGSTHGSARGSARGSASGRSAADSCATSVSYKQASLDVQHAVLTKLSRKISLKLGRFVDCLHDSYFGTLQRCLESLEWSCRAELGGRAASDAVRQLLAGARRVDLLPCASFSLLRTVLDSLLRLFSRLRPGPGAACCPLSAAWRRQVARRTHDALSDQRLARLISAQILERLSAAHSRYQAALAALRGALAQRLHHSGDVKRAIRKKYAPEFARLCLESTSMCDLLLHGAPDLGREIGRGQYGVVYGCRAGWAGRAPAAVKSVRPADERHYSDLAMEFFYTRSIPPHPRIVRLYGSIVQRHGAGGPPTVLLVSQRKRRDLHAAVRAGLGYAARMRVSCDIVEGIRYLHSLGLVHRDIKMKNVLLDGHDRASLADLGFCAAEALISGSVVGTPVHMAPELLDGGYDSSVDVYAFGILFWYVCAGRVRLPDAFEAFQNKEQLWSKVKKGLRPERLACFTDECWDIMQSCWAAEPARRALLGDVQPRLEAVLRAALRGPDPHSDPHPHPHPDPDPHPHPDGNRDPHPDGDSYDDNTDDDSLYMTGLGG